MNHGGAILRVLAVAVVAAAMTVVGPSAGAASVRTAAADLVLDRVMHSFVAARGGPPGIAVVVQRGDDANRFVHGYATGATTDPATKDEQFRFIRGGNSEPPGPGVNAAGLGIFRYQTTCGTVYGHTGNTPGYTQFVAASADGTRSTTVSINAQITPKGDPTRFPVLRDIFYRAVCAAMA